MGLHFTWKDDVEAVTERMAPLVEKTLARWKPRPHHRKIHTISVEEWRQRYPGWRRVAAMAQRNAIQPQEQLSVPQVLQANENKYRNANQPDQHRNHLEPKLAPLTSDAFACIRERERDNVRVSDA